MNVMQVFSRSRWISGLLLVAVATTTLAPMAEAGRRGRSRWKDRDSYCETREVRQVYAPRRARYKRSQGYSSYRVVRSDAGPIIAGFVGGLFLGATLANAAPAGYEYYDPYCNTEYSNLRTYNAHLRGGCGHANVVHVRADEGYRGNRSYHESEQVTEYRREYRREVRQDDGDDSYYGYYDR
jgi:hypothetical protein